MKHLKTLGLAAVAATALMAFAAPASATTLTNGSGEEITTLEATLEGSLITTNTADEPIDTCTESTVSGSINAGTQGTTWVEGAVGVTWGGCTWDTTTLNGGTLDVMSNGDGTGTVVSTGFVWTVTVGPVNCLYGTKTTGAGGTSLGDLPSGTEATLAINVIVEEQEPRKLACPNTARLLANYEVTNPHELVID